MYIGAGGWGKIVAKDAVECCRDAKQMKQGKMAEMERNEEQKWMRLLTNIAVTIFIS